jgi:hypothetical protein
MSAGSTRRERTAAGTVIRPATWQPQYRGCPLTDDLDQFHLTLAALEDDTVPATYYLKVRASQAARKVR